jgi:hypothetical protein
MYPRPVFAFKPDFKPHNRSPSFLHYFLCFKAWLASNWSQKLIYNVYSINRMLWYRVWPTRFFDPINLINYGSDCSISYLDRKLHLQFSPKPLNYFASSLSHCVLLSVLFPTVYNMWVFVAREHHHHFWILHHGEARTVASTVAE